MSMVESSDPSSLQVPQILITSIQELDALCDKTLALEEASPEIQQQGLDAVERSKAAFTNLVAVECKENPEMRNAFLEVLIMVTYKVDKLATKQGFGTASTSYPITPTPFDR